MTMLDMIGTMEETDTGAIARETLARRAARKAAVAFKRTVVLVLALVALAVAAIASYGYQTRITGHLTDNRECTWSVGDYELKGTRSYTYPYLEVFGFRNVDTSKIEEKTKLIITGTGMSVLSLIGNKWELTTVKEGERGTQPLKQADTYVFQIGKNWGVAKYSEFCK